MYPATAIKARMLENHDQPRAAARFGRGPALRNWTLFAMLLEGCFFAYAGEELAIARKPSLFEPDPVDWTTGDSAFEAWFARAHARKQGGEGFGPALFRAGTGRRGRPHRAFGRTSLRGGPPQP